MLSVLKWIGIVILAIVLAIGAFLVGMRFHDGPIEIFTGGPFKTGEPAEAPDDWTFLTDRMEIEFQTIDPDTSRVVWLGVLDKKLYIVSGYMNTGYGKIWKQWPHYLLDDDRIILRIDGKLYEQKMVRLMEHPKLFELMSQYQRKYFPNPDAEALTEEQLAEAEQQVMAGLKNGDFWLFEVVDRDA